MNEQEFQRQKNEIWKKYEKEYNGLIPFKIRWLIENDIQITNNKEYLDYLDRSLPDILDDLNHMPKKYDQATKTEPKISGKRTYQKPFEKRLYLVDFIFPLTKVNLRERSFYPHKRIDWIQKCKEWNEKHPYDRRTNKTLRQEFYRVIRDDDLRQEYFRRKEEEILLSFLPLKEAIDKIHRRSEPSKEAIDEIYRGSEALKEEVQRVVYKDQLLFILKVRIQQLEINKKGENP